MPFLGNQLVALVLFHGSLRQFPFLCFFSIASLFYQTAVALGSTGGAFDFECIYFQWGVQISTRLKARGPRAVRIVLWCYLPPSTLS